ncbi:glycosyltransferase family 9 protein [Polymorphospora sp. NPDC051019]|uniref:glycosyltransferase family 9 protein n=1 Tax=Polymorphospora sp. NPDC051019 TaxID=3155725 RepID=UPI00341F383B
MTEPYREILVVDLLGGLGDLVMLLPAVHALARRHPAAALRVLTHEPGGDLLRGDPAVTEVITIGQGHSGAERAAVVDALALHRPDLAVTTTRYDAIPALLEDGAGRAVTDLWRRPPPDQPVGERYLRILYAEGLIDAADVGARPRLRLRPEELDAGELMMASWLPRENRRPPVLLVVDAGMGVKRWPRRHWQALVRLLRHDGYPVLAVGGPDGRPPPCPLLPRTGLRRLAALFAAAGRRGGVVVGADTGPVRVAAAAGAGTVALFGPTDARRYGLAAAAPVAAGTGAPANPARTGPASPGGLPVDLQGRPDCPHRQPTTISEQSCWWTADCPLSPAGPACMADIDPGTVAAAVRRTAGPDRGQARPGRPADSVSQGTGRR